MNAAQLLGGIPMDDLQRRRLQVARDHMRLEITHEWDAVLATFEHPHYDINDGQAVFDGRDAVLRYFTQSRIPFPDQGNEVIAMAADGDKVLVEFWLTGTHLGPLRRGKSHRTGRQEFRVRMMSSFEFKPASTRSSANAPYQYRRGSTALGLRSSAPSGV